MVNLELERGGHGPSQRLSTPTTSTVATPRAGRLASEVDICLQCSCRLDGYPASLRTAVTTTVA